MKKTVWKLCIFTLLTMTCDQSLRAQSPQNPTNNEVLKAQAVAAAEKKAAHDAAVAEKYKEWVSTLPPERQAWEKVLQENLGSFYLPAHEADKLAGKSNAWDYVQDDPKLPRILLIGDSVSRGYTDATRRALAGIVNVHRAPANCGGTSYAVKKIDVWLGDGKWDAIHFNFGLHDGDTPVAEYSSRLESLIKRMQLTGAKLVWASTTPRPDDPKHGAKASSVIERNEAAAEIMKKYNVAIDDLFTAISPKVGEYQNPPPDVHFKPAGYEFLGQQVANSISAALNGGNKPPLTGTGIQH